MVKASENRRLFESPASRSEQDRGEAPIGEGAPTLQRSIAVRQCCVSRWLRDIGGRGSSPLCANPLPHCSHIPPLPTFGLVVRTGGYLFIYPSSCQGEENSLKKVLFS